MRRLLCLLLVCHTSLACAQNEPVTQGEVRGTLLQTEKHFRAVLKMPPPKPSGKMLGDGEPTTRRFTIERFAALVETLRPKFKIRPRPLRFDEKRLAKLPDALRTKLIALVRGGFIAPLGPLATAKGESVTLKEYGDALGYLISRLAEVTHMPSTKFSPYLQPPD
ncbi:MAG TPA: hypothetical protein PLH94_11090 [Fimbriimonadaceae bacterium]|nr:hypothetical protein [Fimbriimonadaceae bacterium]